MEDLTVCFGGQSTALGCMTHGHMQLVRLLCRCWYRACVVRVALTRSNYKLWWGWGAVLFWTYFTAVLLYFQVLLLYYKVVRVLVVRVNSERQNAVFLWIRKLPTLFGDVGFSRPRECLRRGDPWEFWRLPSWPAKVHRTQVKFLASQFLDCWKRTAVTTDSRAQQ